MLVFAKWKRLGIEPANLRSNGVFVRRVYLDVIGTLPTAEEAPQFLLDKDPGERQVTPPNGAAPSVRCLRCLSKS